jgi:tetratricopeptide (TPR) repeat protein
MMKHGKFFQFAFFTYLLLSNIIVSGQRDPSKNPNYGADSISRKACANDLSTMAEFMKVNLPEDALPAWRKVFVNCPASSKNIYINGAKIFQDLIERTKDPDLQSAYFDTLMQIYDRRIQYFGEEGYVLGRKGKDIMRYKNQDYEKAYETLFQSLQKSDLDVDPGVSVGVIETGVFMFKSGKITVKELLNNYLLISETTNKQLINGGKPEIAEQVFTRINSALGKAELNNCPEIEDAFREKLATGSEDQRILILITDLLQKSNCENSDFFGEVYEKLFILKPTSDLAYTLAWFYIRKEKYEPAISCLAKAIEIEKDADKQAHYYYQMALICNTKMNRQQDAATYAKEALNLLPSWGEPYFVIASAYILGSKDCFEGAFERSAVYWVATDKCLKAKTTDNALADKANEFIIEYSRFYPNTEEVFFRSLQEGSEYTVGCWINEKTTVRVRK